MEINIESSLKRRISSQSMKSTFQKHPSERNLFSRNKLLRYNSRYKLNNGERGHVSSRLFRKMSSNDSFRWFTSYEESPVEHKPAFYPPIILPPIYNMKQLPFQERDMSFPTPRRGPITDREWMELRACRYLRPRLYPQERHRSYHKKRNNYNY